MNNTDKNREIKPYSEVNAYTSVCDSYSQYAVEVNSSRMVPSLIGSLKPIQKRFLQAFLVLNKKNILCKEIVGFVQGYLSPHETSGDSISPLTQHWSQKDCNYVYGIGGWSSRGFIYSGQGADRYIHCELSTFAEKQLKDLWKFSDFYINELDYNEVVALPILYPHALLNGCGVSMGVGLQTSYPQCSFDSIKLAIKEILKGTPIDKIPVEYQVKPYSLGHYEIDDESLKGLNYTGKCYIKEYATIEEKYEGSRKYFIIKDIPLSISPSVVLEKMSNEIDQGLIYVEDISTEDEIIVKVGREKGIKQITDEEIKAKLEKLYKCSNTYSMYAVDEKGNAIRVGALQILEATVNYCLKCYRRYLEFQLKTLDEKILFEKVKGRIRELTKQDEITAELMINDKELLELSNNKLTLDLLKKFLGKSISTLISKKKDTTEMELNYKEIENKINNLNMSYLEYIGL